MIISNKAKSDIERIMLLLDDPIFRLKRPNGWNDLNEFINLPTCQQLNLQPQHEEELIIMDIIDACYEHLSYVYYNCNNNRKCENTKPYGFLLAVFNYNIVDVADVLQALYEWRRCLSSDNC